MAQQPRHLPVTEPQKSTKVANDSTILLIGLCFIVSGATGLIYEVLWARMLGLVFGATTLAVSTVLAAFMGGLALGSALAGKLAPRIKKPLATYGWMEIGIAAYALLVPLLFRWIDHVYALIWQQFQPGFFAFSLWRFVLSGLVLLVPTTLMGATLPVLAAAVVFSVGQKFKLSYKALRVQSCGCDSGDACRGICFVASARCADDDRGCCGLECHRRRDRDRLAAKDTGNCACRADKR